MKNFKLSKKSYLVAFVCVMIVNVFLGIFLVKNVLAQTSDNKFKNQPPVIAKVVEQKDCPLLVTIMNVDNSNNLFQRVDFTVQNVSGKNIRAYTVLSKRITTTIPTTKLFQVGESKIDALFVERESVKSPEVFFSIDYVEFEDGSFWGEDTQKESERIEGERAGRKKALEELNKLVKDNDFAKLKSLLEQNITKIYVPMPDSSQPDKWQKGFQSGYKVVISVLQQQKTQDLEIISRKLADLEYLSK